MAQMQAADFFRLRPLRNKTGVHIQIIQRRGMPFFFLRNKKRKAFFTGMILGGILIFFLTGRIWNIHIEGNVRNSTGEILDFLDTQDINHGNVQKKRSTDSEVAAAVQENFPGDYLGICQNRRNPSEFLISRKELSPKKPTVIPHPVIC